MMRFWFDLGVDGFRIDVAHGLAKADGAPGRGSGRVAAGRARRPAAIRHWDRDEVHDIYREWRALADSYEDPRVFVAEAWVHDPERLAHYVRADELHTAFNFDFLAGPVAGGPAARGDHASRCARTRRSARRRPGCSPTTTRCGRYRATRARRVCASCATCATRSICPPTWSWAARARGRPRC